MGFTKHQLHLPLTTTTPPPSNHHICSNLFMSFLILLHIIFFLTITLPSTTSFFPTPPTSNLISGEFNLTTLTAAGNFSGAWKLQFNVSNPPSAPFISILPTSVSIISTSDNVILAQTHDVTLLRADVIQASLNSPGIQHLDDAVLEGLLADRVHGFLRFNVEIGLKTEHMMRNVPLPSGRHIRGSYKVKCSNVEFRLAGDDDSSEFGVAKIAPVPCRVSSSLEDIMGKIVWPVM